MAANPKTQSGDKIGSQIVLPLSKAIEISLKSLKVRFWRSLITMSSIILAIAFLMSIWATTAVVASLRSGPAAELAMKMATLQLAQGEQKNIPGEHLDAVQQRLADARAAYAAKLPGDIAAAREAITALETSTTGTAEERQAQMADLTATVNTLEAEVTRFSASQSATPGFFAYLRDEVRKAEGRNESIKLMLGDSATAADAGEAAGGGANELAALGQESGMLDIFTKMHSKDVWLVSLALLVCFVGIVNAMLMSVSERFREIGTMKCLGALDSFIVKLFLLESSFQGFVGTALGVAVGFLLILFRSLLSYGGYVIDYFPGAGVAASAVICLLIGFVLSVLAAIYPASTAARMEPVDAMRVDE